MPHINNITARRKMGEHSEGRMISFRNKWACQISIPRHCNYWSPLTADVLVTSAVLQVWFTLRASALNAKSKILNTGIVIERGGQAAYSEKWATQMQTELCDYKRFVQIRSTKVKERVSYIWAFFKKDGTIYGWHPFLRTPLIVYFDGSKEHWPRFIEEKYHGIMFWSVILFKT